MTPSHGLRLVPLDPPSTTLVSLKEPRLRLVVAGEEAFGVEWGSKLAERSDAFLRERSGESLLERLAAERRYVGLVGISPRRELNLLESIAAAAEPTRQRLILVAPMISEDLAKRLLRVDVGDFVTAATSVDEITVRLELRTLKSYGAVLPRAKELDTSLEHAQHVASSGAETMDQAHRVRLSPIESRLYALFAQRFGDVISREEILRIVWDNATGHAKTSNIVDVYVRYLRVKLESAAPQLKIVTVRDVGYGLCERTSMLASPDSKRSSARQPATSRGNHTMHGMSGLPSEPRERDTAL